MEGQVILDSNVQVFDYGNVASVANNAVNNQVIPVGNNVHAIYFHAIGAAGITNLKQGPRASGTAFVMLHHGIRPVRAGFAVRSRARVRGCFHGRFHNRLRISAGHAQGR